MISHNLPDPVQQEKIRRGPHTYMATDGMHGRYITTIDGVPTQDPKATGIYRHQEYPKIMDRTPYPELKDFKGKVDAEILLEHERHRWDERQTASIVNNLAEEKKWLAEHANDPKLTPGAYPKTLDRTPAPRYEDCTGVEDYRQKRTAWREQIASSIVHDEVEEQLWLEEHPLATRSKLERVTVKRGKAKAKAAA